MAGIAATLRSREPSSEYLLAMTMGHQPPQNKNAPHSSAANLVAMAKQLARHGESVLTEESLDQLDRIRVTTLRLRVSIS